MILSRPLGRDRPRGAKARRRIRLRPQWRGRLGLDGRPLGPGQAVLGPLACGLDRACDAGQPRHDRRAAEDPAWTGGAERAAVDLGSSRAGGDFSVRAL